MILAEKPSSRVGFSRTCRVLANLSVRHGPACSPLVQINYFPSHCAPADLYRFRKSTGPHLAVYPAPRYAESLFYLFAAQQFLCLGLSHDSHPFLLSPGLPFQVRDLQQDRFFFLPRLGRCASCCNRRKSVRSAAPLPRPPVRPGDTGPGAREGGRLVHRPSTCGGLACSTKGPRRQRPGPSSEKACRQFSRRGHLGA